MITSPPREISLSIPLQIEIHSSNSLPVIEIVFNYFRTWKLLVCHQFPHFQLSIELFRSPPLDEHLMIHSIIHLTHNVASWILWGWKLKFLSHFFGMWDEKWKFLKGSERRKLKICCWNFLFPGVNWKRMREICFEKMKGDFVMEFN